MPQHELERMLIELEEEMIAAADELRFEYAAQLRDELRELRRDLREIHASEAPAGELPAAGRNGDGEETESPDGDGSAASASETPSGDIA